MKATTPQYQDLIQSVEISVSPEDKKFIDRYFIIINILRVIAICLLLFCLFSIIFSGFIDWIDENISYMLAIAAVIIYGGYRSFFSKKMRNVLLKKCDPVKCLSLYSELVSHARKGKSWELHFYNLAMNLYYAGRLKDAERVQSLLAKYCLSNKGKIYYEMIAVSLAAYRQDLEDVERHCSVMAELKKVVNLKGTMHFMYIGTMMYPTYIQLFRDEKYKELYDYIKESMTLKKSLLAEVKRNYYLYKVALLLEDNEKADEHKKFVMQNGGTLWYPREL